jgi:hypothetical protein
MGLTITYSGTLDEPARLPELVRDVQSFCQRLGWQAEEYTEHLSGILIGMSDEEATPDDEPWPEKLANVKSAVFFRLPRNKPPQLIEEIVRGIIVIPPGTDCVPLKFNQQGRLCGYLDVPSKVVLNAVPGETHYFGFPLWTKTTGAVDSHIGICALLKMLKKYMSNLAVADETGFWETGDLAEMRRQHKVMGGLVGMLSEPDNFNAILMAAGLADVKPVVKVAAHAELPERRGEPPRPKRPVS